MAAVRTIVQSILLTPSKSSQDRTEPPLGSPKDRNDGKGWAVPELRGSKTEANLRRAFALESEASRRFLFFAQQADIEGEPEAATLFQAVAEGETGHALGHLDFLIDVGDPASGLPIGSTEENLRAAVAGEQKEADELYPAFAEQARSEGFDEIADWMESLGQAGSSNAERFAEAGTKLGSQQA